MKHIHQHKSHNTIDLDLQSLYSISIKKYYNDSMQQAILFKLQANKQRGESSLFIHKRVHGFLKEGAPSGMIWAAKC